MFWPMLKPQLLYNENDSSCFSVALYFKNALIYPYILESLCNYNIYMTTQTLYSFYIYTKLICLQWKHCPSSTRLNLEHAKYWLAHIKAVLSLWEPKSVTWQFDKEITTVMRCGITRLEHKTSYHQHKSFLISNNRQVFHPKCQW